MKSAVVLGAGGFIGSHMVERLREEGYWVRGVDLKFPEFADSVANDFAIGDLRDEVFVANVLSIPASVGGAWTDVYQFAADMGGAGFVFTGENDSALMHNSAVINLNVANQAVNKGLPQAGTRLFYSSSACIYPLRNQMDPTNPQCSEASAYPAEPDSEYGWEKLFSERLYLAYARNHGLDVRIARYHNIYGPKGTWTGGREKAPAAICRKVASAESGGLIEVWGSGEQTRSFLFIDDCIEGTRRLVESQYRNPVNIGSEEMVSINDLVSVVCEVAGKELRTAHIDGPIGVNGRTSDNSVARAEFGWDSATDLRTGIGVTYRWIQDQVTESARRI